MTSILKFRDATVIDYDAVMDISDNIYDGLDYLPARYLEYCRDPQRHMFVAEDNGKVVAFMQYHIIDDGRASIKQAGRVHKELMGRGVMTSLEHYARSEIMKRCPTIKHEMYTTYNTDGVKSSLKKNPIQKLLCVKPNIPCGINLQILPAILKSSQFHSLKFGGPYQLCRRQSEDEALSSLLHDVPFSQFVPGGMWIINGEPMGNHVNNYRKVLGMTSFYVSRVAEDSAIQALSFCTFVRVPVGWRCRADFYCPKSESNPFVLVAHVLRHLEEMTFLKGAEHMSYSVLYPESHPGNAAKQLLFTHLPDLKQLIQNPMSLVSMDIADANKRLNAQSRL